MDIMHPCILLFDQQTEESEIASELLVRTGRPKASTRPGNAHLGSCMQLARPGISDKVLAQKQTRCGGLHNTEYISILSLLIWA
jgi:hypothetical protein